MKRKWTTQEVKEWYQATGALTYCNKEDANIIVKKPFLLSEDVTAAPVYYLNIILLKEQLKVRISEHQRYNFAIAGLEILILTKAQMMLNLNGWNLVRFQLKDAI